MRVGSLVLASSSILALLAAVACTQTTQTLVPIDEEEENQPAGTDEASDPKADTPTQGKTDDTCLGKASLAFDDAECNACMSDDASCCQATISCFKDDADCAAPS